MADFSDLLRKIDQRAARQIENREALRGAIAAVLGEETEIEWGDAEPRTIKGVQESFQGMFENVSMAEQYRYPVRFMAGIPKEDLTDEQKQKIAEEMVKPLSKITPTHRKNPDGSITEIATGKTVGHVSGPPLRVKSFSWVQDYDVEHGKDQVRMYATPPEHMP